ncbi:hypothetical protein [Desulfocurvibacter africanus]|uniref:hypothetical protein n=1 Tax=Desulfocurvibacter africanus TaxID=873 RepID=UPI000402FA2E|nr:hypothetical protein [Desulfocurvibacter africanus]
MSILSRLNGWQRLFLILSICWFVVGSVLAVQNAPSFYTEEYEIQEAIQASLQKELDSELKREYKTGLDDIIHFCREHESEIHKDYEEAVTNNQVPTFLDNSDISYDRPHNAYIYEDLNLVNPYKVRLPHIFDFLTEEQAWYIFAKRYTNLSLSKYSQKAFLLSLSTKGDFKPSLVAQYIIACLLVFCLTTAGTYISLLGLRKITLWVVEGFKRQ